MKIINRFLDWSARWDDLVEGRYADQYADPALRDRIRAEYRARYCPEPNPFTHPAQYDPLDPPEGWRYDPYYEIWIKS